MNDLKHHKQEREQKAGMFSLEFEEGLKEDQSGIAGVSSSSEELDPQIKALKYLIFPELAEKNSLEAMCSDSEKVNIGEVRLFSPELTPFSDRKYAQWLYAICVSIDENECEMYFFTRFDTPTSEKQFWVGITDDSQEHYPLLGLQVVSLAQESHQWIAQDFLLHESTSVGIFPKIAEEIREVAQYTNSIEKMPEKYKKRLGKTLSLFDQEELNEIQYEAQRPNLILSEIQ